MLSIKCPSEITVALMFKYVILFVALQTETKGYGIFTDRLTDRNSGRHTIKSNIKTDRQTNLQKDRHTDRHTIRY